MPTSCQPRSRASLSSLSATSRTGAPASFAVPDQTPGWRRQGAGQKHYPCGSRPSRPGQTRRQATPSGARTPLSQGAAPNDLWCADFKGEFKLGNGRYCYPLTVTDHASALPLAVRGTGINPRRHRLSHSSGYPPSAACRLPSAPIMASPSPAPMPCSTSPSSPSGGCASASPSNASSQASRSRTDAMNACI